MKINIYSLKNYCSDQRINNKILLDYQEYEGNNLDYI